MFILGAHSPYAESLTKCASSSRDIHEHRKLLNSSRKILFQDRESERINYASCK